MRSKSGSPVFLIVALMSFAAPAIAEKQEVFPPAGGLAPLTPARERSLGNADTFQECDACPEMAVVPSGSFMMGSPAREVRREFDEGPEHRVTFARPFAVGKFAVTFDEWDACVADGGCN